MERIYVGKTCPYCKTPFKVDDVVAFCNTCAMPHHLACWQANEKCTTYGCSGTIDVIINQEKANKQEVLSTVRNTGQQSTNDKSSANAERYETIFEIIKGKLQDDVPVLIEKVSLIKSTVDETIFARCLFRSLTDESIKAMLLDVKATDVWGNQAEGVEGFQLLDLKTKRESVFGQTTPIPIPDKNVRGIEVIIRKVLFEDRRMIECKETYSSVPAQPTLASSLGRDIYIEHYAELTSKVAKYVPVVGDKVWRCTCGAINPVQEDICYSCKVSLLKQQAAYNPEQIIAETDALIEEKRKKEEEIRIAREREQKEAEERLRKAQEEKERQEREKIEAKKAKAKKRLKRFGLSMIGVIILAGIVYWSGWHLIPFIRYSVAGSNVEKNNFDSAYNTYISLGDYRDCPDKAIETLYAKAAYLEGLGQFAEAAAEYEKVSGYKDSDTKAIACKNEANYRDAKAKYEAKDFETAISQFTSLGDYADSKDWLLKAQYAQAKEYFDNADYYKAFIMFYGLGNYQDAADQANESLYLYAVDCENKKQYGEASDAYGSLKDYKDSQDKFKEVTYAYAKSCYDSEDYNNARAYFAKINGYEDADDLWIDASYEYALEKVDSNDYQTAVSVFTQLDGYKESNSKAIEAKYAYVKEHMNSMDDITYSYLKDLKAADYSDSKTIYDDLYAWKVSVVTNTSETDETTAQFRISKYSTLYVHIKLTGGAPGESVRLTYTYNWPGLPSKSDSWDWDMHNGSTTWFSTWLSEPYRASSGTFTYSIYTSDGTKLASRSVNIY